MYHAIVFLPLLGCLIAGLFPKTIGDRAAQIVPSALLVLSAFLSWIALYQVLAGYNDTLGVARWMTSGDLDIAWSLRIDALTAVMLVVVTTVSAVVHVYSIGYMEHDDSRPRFFSYLSLFTFAMLMLVTADNFVQMFFGWEGVGVASYLLIGFWYKKPSANSAAMKAFIVNRVGDFGFALGIFGVFAVFGTLDFDAVFAAVPDYADKQIHFLGADWGLMNTLTFLLFIGAMGKSAQFMLHTWLPDAMEGPTPVSALIHAATMVTAGVFLVCRLSPMFEYAPWTLGFVTFIGATTALFAATVGLVQNDIKRIIAYSTCSQLGYMFFAAGVGAYEAAMFHLFTHAFFKALLFLGAGSVIHALHEEQDIRNMGGLRGVIPITFIMMVVGTVALTGLPPLAGYFSKDMILEAAWASGFVDGGHGTFVWGQYAFALGLLVAGMTAFYSWRLVFKVFFGPYRGPREKLEHAHESPPVMLIPLAVLALGSIVAGAVFYDGFVGDGAYFFWQGSIGHGPHNHVLHEAHYVPFLVKKAPLVASVLGLFIAWLFYIRRLDLPSKTARSYSPLYDFFLNKWRFDELYEKIFIRPAMALGRFLWKKGDGKTIDGAIDGLAMGIVPFFTRLASRAQSGFVFDYAFAMIIGLGVLLGIAVFGGAG